MARALTLALLLQLSIPSAFAQYVTVIAACTRDATKFCPAALPQRNALAECIEAHFQHFHEQCRAALVQPLACVKPARPISRSDAPPRELEPVASCCA